MTDLAATDAPRDSRPWTAVAVEVLAREGFIVIFAVWAAYLAIATDTFLTHDNVLLLLRQAAIFSIVGIGATMVTILGELDISFGATLALAGCVSRGVGDRRAPTRTSGSPSPSASAASIGLVNGRARQLRADPLGRRHARDARRRRRAGPDVHRRLEHLRRSSCAGSTSSPATSCSASRSPCSSPSRCTPSPGS